jgi:hypothetical protein
VNVRYRVELSQAERDELTAMLSAGKHAARRLKRAQILLAADAGRGDEEISRTVAVGESLLDSYNEERRPVGRKVIDRAMKSHGQIGPWSEAAGLGSGMTEQDAKENIGQLFGASAIGEKRRQALLAGIDLMNYQFNAHGVELSQRYRGEAIASSEPFPDYGEWTKIREVSDRGCLLVRPDRFIAWRTHDLPGDPAAALREAMLAVLRRGTPLAKTP